MTSGYAGQPLSMEDETHVCNELMAAHHVFVVKCVNTASDEGVVFDVVLVICPIALHLSFRADDDAVRRKGCKVEVFNANICTHVGVCKRSFDAALYAVCDFDMSIKLGH